MGKYNLVIQDVLDSAYPRDYFLQNIQRMIHIKASPGTTLQGLKDKLAGNLSDDQDALIAIDEFIEFQKENGLEDDTVVVPEEGDGDSVFHFDLRTR